MVTRSRPGPAARRAAGRLCLVDFSGPSPSPALERLIADRHIMGVVLFRKNVDSPSQVAGLTDALQRLAREAAAPPPWVAIDHEGGAVTRFSPCAGGPLRVTSLPSAMALGAAGDPALASAAGRVAGCDLRAIGIHLNFAPVLDVNTNPSNPVIGARAFGDSPSEVAALGVAYIQGLQEAGVAAVGKHFPGHGDTSVDSHLGLPRVGHGRERLEVVEMAPFAAAVRAGVAGIMTAHAAYPALDPSGVPATMSEPILRGILRERWGFGGLVFTDSMSMRAIADNYGAGDAAVAAVRAGCDVVLALGEEAAQQEMLDRLAAAIEQGEITEARLAEIRSRAAEAAGRWGIGAARPAGAAAPSMVPEHGQIAERIASTAVTLVRDRSGAIPVRSGQVGVVTVPPPAAASSERVTGPGCGLALALRRQGAAVREVSLDDASTADGVIVAVTCAQGAPEAGAVAAVRSLYRRVGDRLIVVGAGAPYEAAALPEIPAYLAAYGPDEPSMSAAARVLLGRAPARGKLPVRLESAPGGHTRAAQ